MTEKIYETDAFVSRFDAAVTSCTEEDGRYAVVLDRTAFFPEGGGQSADGGTIGGVCVLDVRNRGDEVVHFLPSPVSGRVSCVLDWETRFSRMQNHSGEHVMSGVIHNRFGYENVGFHMGHDCVTLDTSGPLSKEQVAQVEEEVNRVVWENRPIRIFFPTAEEQKSLVYRSKLDITEHLRIVQIEGVDLCACCAPHVERTGQIGCVKVLNSYPYKGGTRIEIASGKDALLKAREYLSYSAEITKLLSVPAEKTAGAVEKLLGSLHDAETEIRSLRLRLAGAEMERLEVGDTAIGLLRGMGFEEMQSVAPLLGDGPRALFSFDGEITLFMLLGAPALGEYLKTALNAKGGGRDGCVRGKIPAGEERVRKALIEFGK